MFFVLPPVIFIKNKTRKITTTTTKRQRKKRKTTKLSLTGRDKTVSVPNFPDIFRGGAGEWFLKVYRGELTVHEQSKRQKGLNVFKTTKLRRKTKSVCEYKMGQGESKKEKLG